MLLYWGMFTAGFTIGTILSFVIFAPKKPEEEENQPTTFVLINNGKKEQQLVEKAPELSISPQAAKES